MSQQQQSQHPLSQQQSQNPQSQQRFSQGASQQGTQRQAGSQSGGKSLRIAVISADGYTGMTLMQELSLQQGSLPIESCVAFVEKSRKAEAQDIQKMNKSFHCKFYDPSNLNFESDLKDVDVLMLIPPAQPFKKELCESVLQCCQNMDCVVMLSSLGADEEVETMKEFKSLEGKVLKMNNACVLRSAFYAQNLLLYTHQIAQGYLPLPIREQKMTMVDLADVGVLMVKILRDFHENKFDQHKGKTYHLTGQESCSGNELADLLTQVVGRKIEWNDIPLEQAETILKNTPLIDNYEAKYLLQVYQLAQKGKMDVISKDFIHLCQDQPTSVKEFMMKYQTELKSAIQSAE
jgi:hypothetical protein